jgi:peptidoglycan/LPS O-acetylase OafA/YrhL
MVDFFFVLSGFVIAYRYQEQIKNLHDCINFQTKRFLRLYPLHLIMLIAFLGVECSKYIAQTYFGLNSNVSPFSVNDATSFIFNLLLLQNIFQGTLTWNGPSWSISSEFYTYILFATLTASVYKKRVMYFIALFIIISLSFYLLLISNMSSSNGLLRCLYSFFLGVLVYHIHTHLALKIPSALVYLVLLLSIISICLTGGEDVIDINIFVPLLFSILIYSLLTSPEDMYFKTILQNKFLIRLGTISYGIYMVHILVWWIIIQSLRLVFKFPTIMDSRGMTEVIINGQLLSTFIVLTGLGIIVFLANYSYEKLEKPINNYRKKLT